MGLAILGAGLVALLLVLALVNRPQDESRRQVVLVMFAAGFLVFGFLGVCTATALPINDHAANIGLGPLIWTVIVGSIILAIAFAMGIWRNWQ